MAQPSYFVPVQMVFTEGIQLGSPILLPVCNVAVQYDTGSEFPNQPFKDWIAWANCLWKEQ